MQIIPLHLYRPETLNFRIKNRDYAVLKVAPEAALFVGATPEVHAKSFLLGLNNKVSAFYLDGERLVVGEATHSKHGLYFECEIRDQIVITACIGILTDEQYAALMPISSTGISLKRNAFSQVSVVYAESTSTHFVLEESPFPFNPLDDHRSKWSLQEGAKGELVLYHQEMLTCAWRSPHDDAHKDACDWLRGSLSLDDVPMALRAREVLPERGLGVSFVLPEPLLDTFRQENPACEALIETLLFSNASQRFIRSPVYPDGHHEVLIVGENPSIALLGRRILSGYTVSKMLIINDLLDCRVIALSGALHAKGFLPRSQTLALTGVEHRNILMDIESGARGNEVNLIKVEPPQKPVEIVYEFKGMSVSVAKRKVVTEKPLAVISTHKNDQKVIKIEQPKLSIHSFSRIDEGGIWVEVVWTYEQLREALVYQFMPSAMEDFQIFCELLAVRDVLLSRLNAHSVPLSVGAQDIELMVSKGAIKRMIRSDSVKLKTIWAAARYLMARCCFSKVDVKKESPLSVEDQPIKQIISLSVDESVERVPSALGPLRLSHHALKRVMERRSEQSGNSWSYALKAIASAKHVKESGAFDKLKHEQDARFLMSDTWRFVVVDSKDRMGGVVLTAVPNKMALPSLKAK
jgi:hypothetical protein